MNTLFKSIAVAVFASACAGLYAQSSALSALEKAKSSGSIVMGVRESGGAVSFALGDTKYSGFHVELCQRIVAEIEKQVGRKVEINYQLVTAQNRIPLLQNGTIDIECGVTTNNAIRQKDVAFLSTTYVEEVRMAVRANSGLTSVSQLTSKSVATTTGSTGVQHLRRHERSLGVDFREVYGKDASDSFLLLESGRAEAFVTDSQILASLIAVSKNPSEYIITGEVLNVEPIAIMIRKDDAALKALGNSVIAQHIRSGEMQKLWDKWFNQPIPPKNITLRLPVSPSTRSAWATPNDRPMEDYAKK
jgi:glutamate/aspartate transport system substrate-binding protein